MTSDEATAIVTTLAELFPRWRSTPTLKLEFRDAIMRFGRVAATEAISAHRRQRRGDDPSLAELLNVCAACDRERQMARHERDRVQRDDQRSVFCEAHRRAWNTPGMSDADVLRRYWASQAARMSGYATAAHHRRTWGTLILGDFARAGVGEDEALAFIGELWGDAA